MDGEENDMGVYLEDLTYKEILPILARTGKLIDTRKIIEIDLVRCGECIHRHEHEWYNTCDKHIGHGFEDDYFCKYGERNSKNNSNQI